MKVCLLWMVLACALLPFGPSAGAQPASPPRGNKELVAVLDLDGVNADKAQLAALSDELRAQLLQTGRFRLVDRDQVNSILKEQAFQQEACTSPECAVRVGKILGVRKLVTGRITKIEAGMWHAAAQMVDVESAETLRAVTISHRGPYDSLLTAGMASLAKKLTDPAPSEGGTEWRCGEDAKKFCAGVKPGEGRLVRCLNGRAAELSPACQETLRRNSEQTRKPDQPCRADAQRLCKDVPRGEGRIIACLRSHAAELSADCRAEIESRRASR